MDKGTRKFGAAALIIGGAVSAGEWEVALIAFGIYTVSNLILKLRPEVLKC